MEKYMKDYMNKPRKPMMAGGMAGGMKGGMKKDMSGGMMPKATPANVDMTRASMGMMYGGKAKKK